MKILLSGATGFLGSHIAEALLNNNHSLMLTKRTQSDMWRTENFNSDDLRWINIDDKDWEIEATRFKAEVIINCSWDGVGTDGRSNWVRQIQNIDYQQQLLEIALESGCKKFIGVGSQAEYGEFSGIKSEDDIPNPNSAYGAAKLAAQVVLKYFCEINNIKWYWFRLFSSFGEREGDNWLIPLVIKNMLTKESMDLTGCEQKYSYLYIKEVTKVFVECIENDVSQGIYNISSKDARRLKEVLLDIKQMVNPLFTLNFGVLSYRDGQSMHNQGSMVKTEREICVLDESGFNENLRRTVDYYKTRYEGI